MRRALLGLIVVAGCKKTPATCKDLAPAIRAWGKAEISADRLTAERAKDRQALFELTADLYPRVCEQDKWSGEAIDCLIAAATEEDAQQCPFTKDQRDDLQKALMDALAGDGSGSGTGGGRAAGGGGAGGGSGTGSAK